MVLNSYSLNSISWQKLAFHDIVLELEREKEIKWDECLDCYEGGIWNDYDNDRYLWMVKKNIRAIGSVCIRDKIVLHNTLASFLMIFGGTCLVAVCDALALGCTQILLDGTQSAKVNNIVGGSMIGVCLLKV